MGVYSFLTQEHDKVDIINAFEKFSINFIWDQYILSFH